MAISETKLIIFEQALGFYLWSFASNTQHTDEFRIKHQRESAAAYASARKKMGIE
ncbi:hypothetical protein [Delftia phage PhiW-14]|uniref:Uncharacterized protein n=1 Tax=Delftia phage PhiW-14 TaxID=665032 RepID=C9DGA5_BPW14|nr:hypothetical protein DP-phiW-14_gp135 [Delftia phage PhiW-14]ACV50156.1 hypothetical protein [Delftia phage PhiW-14]